MLQAEWENLASLLSLGCGVMAAMVLGTVRAAWAAIDTVERCFIHLSRRSAFCWIALPLLSLAINLLITLHRGDVPQSLVQDEASYLLAADTFAHGRITNPTPPFWEHFETPQQLMHPTYMSKYPPAQGLVIALGQLMTGQPIAGVWISSAAAVMAVYWMILGFASAPWALLGGIVAAIHPEILDWSQCYWGGSVTVLGAALTLGAWGRLMKTHSNPAAVVLGVGLIILANSRPFEGLMLSLPLVMALIITRRGQCVRLLAPTGIPLLVAALAMGYYNYRITGRVTQIPYLEYAAQYEIYPKFWFLPPKATLPIYRNATQAFIHRDFEKQAYEGFHSVGSAIANSEHQFGQLFAVLVGFHVLLLPLMVGLLSSKSPKMRWMLFAVSLVIAGVWTEIFFYQHYLSPALPAVWVLVILGWRKMQHWNWRSRKIGQMLSRATAIGVLAGGVMLAAQPPMPYPNLIDQKSTVLKFPLLHQGRHIIFVSYAAMHFYHADLVHNESSLQNSRIIWARAFGEQEDAPVADYFTDRSAWLLNADRMELTPYLRAASRR